MNLLERIKIKEPQYDEKYFDFILTYTIEQGSKLGRSSEDDKYERGKYFSFRYEMYMYATLLGLRKDYKLPLNNSTEKKSFIKIGNWKPETISNYIVISVLAKGDYDFFAMEDLDESELEKKLTQIKSDIEAYANGGFDIIYSKAQEDENYFIENENSFIDLLDE
ncbi:MAG: hypothetical protein JXR11_07385 [Balneola sp.]